MDYEPEKQWQQHHDLDHGSEKTGKEIYAQIHLPDEWRLKVKAEQYLSNDEDIGHLLNIGNMKWLKWQNMAGHGGALLIILIILFVHFTGIHHWKIFLPVIVNPPVTESPKPQVFKLTNIPLMNNHIPEPFIDRITEINTTIEHENWVQMESLCVNMISSQDFDKPAVLGSVLHLDVLARLIKSYTLTKKYSHAWQRFNEYMQIYNTKEKKTGIVPPFPPFHILKSGVIARYNMETKGSYGIGLQEMLAVETVLATLNLIHSNYSEKLKKDYTLMIIKTDALLSSFGPDCEKFDRNDKKKIAKWEQFEKSIAELLNMNDKSRDVCLIQHRKWCKIESFCHLPFVNEQITIGKYAYNEHHAKQMMRLLLKNCGANR